MCFSCRKVVIFQSSDNTDKILISSSYNETEYTADDMYNLEVHNPTRNAIIIFENMCIWFIITYERIIWDNPIPKYNSRMIKLLYKKLYSNFERFIAIGLRCVESSMMTDAFKHWVHTTKYACFAMIR